MAPHWHDALTVATQNHFHVLKLISWHEKRDEQEARS
jgi:hypothetical protein